LNLPGAGDLLSFPKNRLGAKPGLTSGAAGSGFEGFLGSAAAGYALSDAAYKIESPSAVVPDTAIAETVSYWVTHGVQSAELTLDGPDNKSVEVSIVLNGDQAQIEFRTDQADMRQILEGATTHLQDLLSDQGLQLAGVSVGASGAGGTPSDGRQQKPATRQAVWVSTPQAVASVGRSANPSVGRTLDLFV
jgi:flagellar hook-length control protein FliK